MRAVLNSLIALSIAFALDRSEEVDGELLLAITDESLLEDFGMSRLHATRFRVKVNGLIGKKGGS